MCVQLQDDRRSGTHPVFHALRLGHSANDFKVVTHDVHKGDGGAVKRKLKSLTRKAAADVDDAPESLMSRLMRGKEQKHNGGNELITI